MDKGPGKRPRRSSPGTPSATPAQKRFKPSSVDWSGSADLEALLLEQKQNSSAKEYESKDSGDFPNVEPSQPESGTSSSLASNRNEVNKGHKSTSLSDDFGNGVSKEDLGGDNNKDDGSSSSDKKHISGEGAEINNETEDPKSKSERVETIARTQREDIIDKFGIDQERMRRYFQELRLPFHVEKVPISTSDSTSSTKDDGAPPRGNGHYSASTVTRLIMARYGGWLFTSFENWKGGAFKKPDLTGKEIYQVLDIGDVHVEATLEPFNSSTIGTKNLNRPHSEVVRAIRRMRYIIDDGGMKLHIPSDWWVESMRDSDPFPHIPRRFQVILRTEDKESQKGKKVNLPKEMSPAESIYGSQASREPSPPTSVIPITVPDADTTPKARLIELPSTPEKPSALPDAHIYVTGNLHAPSPSPTLRATKSIPTTDDEDTNPSSGAESESDTEEDISPLLDASNLDPRFFAFDDSIGESYARNLGLSPENPGDAKKLRNVLEPLQHEWYIRESKRQICTLIGSPGEKEAFNPLKIDNNTRYRLMAYKTRLDIEDDDKNMRCGNAAYNENTKDRLFTAMEIISKWLEFKGLRKFETLSTMGKSEGRNSKSKRKGRKTEEIITMERSEGSIERSVGGLLQGIFHSEDFVVTENKPMPLIDTFKFLGTHPSPDIGVQARVQLWAPDDWKPFARLISPCVFSAECKREDTLTEKCEAQLAMNTNATINLLILIYLDTRTTQYQKLPAWMCIYSIIYTELGFTIYAHYPTFIPASNRKSSSWRPTSCELSRAFAKVFDQKCTHLDDRISALRVLFMLRSHALFLAEQIKEWAKKRGHYRQGDGVVDRILAAAHLQVDSIHWLTARMK